MNFLQLVNRARQECAVSGPALTTTANQSGESLNFVNWVNAAWLDIQARHEDWQWLRKTATFPTVAGQAIYTTDQIGLTDFGFWSRETFRNYVNPQVTLTVGNPCVVNLPAHRLNVGDTATFFNADGSMPTGVSANTTCYVVSAPTADTFTFSATAGGSPVIASGSVSGTITMTSNNSLSFCGFNSEIYMDYIDYEAWRDSYEYGALRSTKTRPMNMTITPAKAIAVGPFPDAGYTLVGDYFSVPTEMSADTDVPAMPTKFHLAIVYRAMMHYGMYENAQEVFTRGASEFERWIRRIELDRMPEITLGGALC